MHVLISIRSRIPSLYYGGTERVVWYLAKELKRMGHKVTFLASKGSTSDFCNIIEYDETKSIDAQVPADVDVVHVNDDFFAERVTKPVIVTIHGNPENYDGLHLNAVFVSKSHAKRYGSDSFVHNGLDWDAYPQMQHGKNRNTFHFLGNAAWDVKNVHGAIKTVLKTKNETLQVLGGRRFHPNSFSFSARINYLGIVNDEKKAGVISRSKGLVFPVVWDEPFGLALTESLFYGSPVFGTPYGSLPEIVHSDVGFLSNRREELTNAILNSGLYSNKTCSDYAIEYFNSKKMALSYLEKYELVLNSRQLNCNAPKIKNKPVSLAWED